MDKMEKVIIINGMEIIWESASDLMDNDLCNEIASKCGSFRNQIHNIRYKPFYKAMKHNDEITVLRNDL